MEYAFLEQGVNKVQCVSMASWYYYFTSTVGINVNTFYIVAETEHRHILLLINYTLYSYLRIVIYGKIYIEIQEKSDR